MIEDTPGRNVETGWVPRILRAAKHQAAIDEEWSRPVPVVGERAVWSKAKPGRPREFLFWQAEEQPPARKPPLGKTRWVVRVFDDLPLDPMPIDCRWKPLGVREFKTEGEAVAAAKKVLERMG